MSMETLRGNVWIPCQLLTAWQVMPAAAATEPVTLIYLMNTVNEIVT